MFFSTFEPLDEFLCLDMQNEALEVFSRTSGPVYRMHFQNLNIYEIE